MSVANNVYAMRQSLPTPKQWAAALLEAGFEVVLDSEFVWWEFEGFLPATYQGQEAGFELYVESVDANQLNKRERKHLQGRDTVVTLITHSDMREYVSSMLAAAVLCALSDGLLAEGGETPFIAAPDAIDWARDCEPEIVKLMQADG
ncbi:hypothetical protein LVJ82_15520 [Vitreoscilla massiliensis]|uniref:Uncharacterized protein n=1 Tax=Vitreoscilla massiliensis TaxID=1689272 RepID=A0ABY4DZC4_9NEIS|nr:hypothetical protein [Vitreoscilla massiliensis]UOO88846.1 hypothetical protein LVJ82_15520 [Vitreoscilla massiliensis]